VSEFDSPWKEALDRIVREGELVPRLADKLFQVWRVDGEETWVLIHAVQDVAVLRAVQEVLRATGSIAELRSLLK
jgi:hypothetical protein